MLRTCETKAYSENQLQFLSRDTYDRTLLSQPVSLDQISLWVAERFLPDHSISNLRYPAALVHVDTVPLDFDTKSCTEKAAKATCRRSK
mmetsp:Transcript_21213/g.39603  ORF Transcript_21213/g.39603 Transcript_21213/m.39603 type:complete len:89 (+) Transcript_21213:107-373(+)